MGAIIWQLTQTLWVGGLVVLLLGLLAVLDQTGLAPLLIHEFANFSGAVLVGFAAVCAMLQMAVLVGADGISSMWLDLRGQLLLVALLASVSYFGLRHWMPDALHLQLWSYLVLGLSGVLLVLQPLPGRSSRPR